MENIKSINNLQIGKALRDARILSEMTQSQVAEAVEMTVRQIQNIEGGYCVPSVLTAAKIAAVTGASLDSIAGL